MFDKIPVGVVFHPTVFFSGSDNSVEFVEVVAAGVGGASSQVPPLCSPVASVPLLASALASRLAFTAITQTVFGDVGHQLLVSASPLSPSTTRTGTSTPSVSRALMTCTPVHTLLDAMKGEVWLSSEGGASLAGPSTSASLAAGLLSQSLSTVTLGGLAGVAHLASSLTAGALLALFADNVVLAGINSPSQVVRHQVRSGIAGRDRWSGKGGEEVCVGTGETRDWEYGSMEID